jgi:hypothetical protein
MTSCGLTILQRGAFIGAAALAGGRYLAVRRR